MAQQYINNTPINSGSGDTLPLAFTKVNEMFTELYAIDTAFSGELATINTILISINDGSQLNHTHLISQVIGLQTALNSKLDVSVYNVDMIAVNASIQAINITLGSIISILNTKVEEAPADGKIYGRKDTNWEEVIISDKIYISEIEDLFVSTSNYSGISNPYLNYLSLDGVYKYLYIDTLVTFPIFRTNDIIKIENDLIVTGRMTDGGINKIFLLALRGCYFEDGILKYTSTSFRTIDTGIKNNGFAVDIHAMAYKEDNKFLYLQTRPGSLDTCDRLIFKINPNDMSDLKSITIPSSATGGYLDTWRDKLVMINAYYGTGSLLIINDDLSGYNELIQLGVTNQQYINVPNPFTVYRDKVYIPSITYGANPYNKIGLSVYDLESGKLLQQNLDIIIGGTGTSFPVPHWMTVFNDKIIIVTRTSQQLVIRLNLKTLVVEETASLAAYNPITDDNSLFSNGYMYLNSEGSNAGQLLKVKYNDFTDLAVELINYRSAGSINPIVESSAIPNLSKFKTDNFLDATSSIQTQLDSKVDRATWDRTRGLYIFEDFIANLSTTTSPVSISGISGGHQSGLTLAGRNQSWGTLFINSGSSTGSALVQIGSSNNNGAFNLTLGKFSYRRRVLIPVLSTATERYFYTDGFQSTANTVNTFGNYFAYDEGGKVFYGSMPTSPNWRVATADPVGKIITDTLVPVVAGQIYHLRMDGNTDGTELKFYIDDVLVATHTSRIKVDNVCIRSVLQKTDGTGIQVNVHHDYTQFEQIFNTTRL